MTERKKAPQGSEAREVEDLEAERDDLGRQLRGAQTRMTALSACVSEAHAIIWKLLDPRANIDLSPERLADWTAQYRALILASEQA